MHIRFNEVLNGNSLSKSDNFRIEGGMNNVVFDSSSPYPDEAFADLQPEVGDMVKNRRSYAIFGSRGTWEGLLESIIPGEGYVYQSKANVTKTFHYPRTLNGISYSRPLRTVSVVGDAQSPALPAVAHFEPVDDSQFPDNMAVIAVVEKDGNRVEDAEVAAFINLKPSARSSRAIIINEKFFAYNERRIFHESNFSMTLVKIYLDLNVIG